MNQTAPPKGNVFSAVGSATPSSKQVADVTWASMFTTHAIDNPFPKSAARPSSLDPFHLQQMPSWLLIWFHWLFDVISEISSDLGKRNMWQTSCPNGTVVNLEDQKALVLLNYHPKSFGQTFPCQQTYLLLWLPFYSILQRVPWILEMKTAQILPHFYP